TRYSVLSGRTQPSLGTRTISPASWSVWRRSRKRSSSSSATPNCSPSARVFCPAWLRIERISSSAVGTTSAHPTRKWGRGWRSLSVPDVLDDLDQRQEERHHDEADGASQADDDE